MSGPKRIIIIEDEFLIQADYEAAIKQDFPSAEIHSLPDSERLVEFYHRVKPDLIITDLVMESQYEGIKGISEIRSIDPYLPIIVASGHGDFLNLAESFNINGSLQKPINPNQLIAKIRSVFAQ